ncbi:hypothetical protein K502DRAFT_298086, partial [Neoconidiobolus thromboides FSU 785]
INFDSGDLSLYPFDKYQSLLEYGIWDEEENMYSPNLVFETQTQGFELTYDSDIDSEETQLLYINIRRSTTVLCFTILILLAMWCLSFAYLFIICKMVLLKLKPNPFLLPLGAMILFAFPNLRNVMPDVPVIGCWSDTFGYLW